MPKCSINGNLSYTLLYEKDICPIFSVNNTRESTYYPCESVVSIGEIKSTLTTLELEKSFKNIASSKKCRRYIPENRITQYRKFGSSHSIQGARKFDQKNNFDNQIYGFILCQKIGTTINTFLDNYTRLIKEYEKHLLPNILISLEDGIIAYFDKNKKVLLESMDDFTGVANIKNVNGDFQYLLHRLSFFLDIASTSPVIPYDKYILKDVSLSGKGRYKDI